MTAYLARRVVGAIVVVPIWFLARMFKVFGGSKHPQVLSDKPVSRADDERKT